MAFRSVTSQSITAEIVENPIFSALGSWSGGRFEKWSSQTLTYTLNRNDTNPDGQLAAAWPDALSRAIRQAHEDISDVSRLKFREVPDRLPVSDGADLDYWYYRNPFDGSAGYSYGVGGNGSSFNADAVYLEGVLTGDGLAYGGINYGTVIHEALHNLGLDHPHEGFARLPGVSSDDDTGNSALNQMLYTVMSYNRVDQVDAQGRETTGYPFTYQTVDRSFATLGTFDIAMLQLLYGANMQHATGDTIYRLPNRNETGTHYKAIWDAGGTDEFRFDGGRDVRIDLRPATLDLDDGMRAGGLLSSAQGVHGGYTIAFGARIENATGGSGDDAIVGNGFGNVLNGRGGGDRISGLGGSDTIIGGTGRDDLSGARGNDVIRGLGGADDMRGGAGFDWLDYRGSGGVTVNLQRDIARGGHADGDKIASFEGVIGSARGDRLLGDRGANKFEGHAGNDVIKGGGGRDVVSGGPGRDKLFGGPKSDLLDYSGSEAGVLVNLSTGRGARGDAAGDRLASFERVRGSAEDDKLIGGDGKNILIGGRGADVLNGRGGQDMMKGQGGSDTFQFNFGSDVLKGGKGRDHAYFRGDMSDYDVKDRPGASWKVVDLSTGHVDILKSVEVLHFDDMILT
ncbi:M10 family metallopeptidase C-terminal domain-containing protein [Sulfitobacter sp. D35]|uniref:M10 family metallopeptidase C-terminal domain-containing protein n=1 Tax=Sulfitobacter sp. D35 TaxID=3083252 RepID=UPI00296E2D20|nr:M10 family metallopeptidase C-terminal domain-containing protein [Sulfitobacter sp. D35]MDW4496425.1 M10 family metallopeptidase C-terminal domain-containing protein [Sulfitobacter sp. D35]